MTLPQVYKLGQRYVIRARTVDSLADVAAAILAEPDLVVSEVVRGELALAEVGRAAAMVGQAFAPNR